LVTEHETHEVASRPFEPAQAVTTSVKWGCRNCNGRWNGGSLLLCDECETAFIEVVGGTAPSRR
jgi:hypothetical protein